MEHLPKKAQVVAHFVLLQGGVKKGEEMIYVLPSDSGLVVPYLAFHVRVLFNVVDQVIDVDYTTVVFVTICK